MTSIIHMAATLFPTGPRSKKKYQDHFFCFNISDKVKLTSNWYDSIWIICIRCRHIVT